MEETRRLSTILFADIAGYTSMMQKDERHALGLLNQFKTVLEELVPANKGNIIQYFGDGCLLSFESATDGVECALALQLSLIKQQIPVRIGMHLGEVVFKNNNAFGDGVNIASRVESMGISGSIIISKAIRDQIKNKADFQLTLLGAYQFKNVDAPMQIFALANDGLIVPKRHEMKGKLNDGPGNLFQRLWEKRIPQIMAVYILIAWLGLQLFDWALHQFGISPHWAQIFFIFVIGIIPSLLAYLNNRERIHQSQLKLGEKILFPSNLIIVGAVLFFMFRTTDLGATTKEIQYTTADGTIQNSTIVKQEFRKTMTLFNFEGQGVDSSVMWLKSGISTLLMYDIQQDKAVNIVNLWGDIPMSGKINKIDDFFVDGTYAMKGGIYTITPEIHIASSGKVLSSRSFSGADLFTVLDSISIYVRQEAGISKALMEASTDLPLKDFTSSSLKAIQYACAQNLASMERAIELDSTFALASLQLGIALFNKDISNLDTKFYLDRAFRHRHKLPFYLQYSVLSYLESVKFRLIWI